MVKHSDTLLPHYIPTPTLCALTGGRLALQFLWKHEHKVAAHVRPCYPLTPHKCSDRFTTRLLGLYYLNPFMLQLRPEESLQCKIFFKKKATDLLSENLLFFYFICVLYRGFNIELRVAFHICKNAYTVILQYFLLPNKLLSVFKDFILDAALFE